MTLQFIASSGEWVALTVSVVMLLGYEWRLRRLEKDDPTRVARLVHARLRAKWVEALATQPGTELLAVQTLRNSLMSATIVASTSALALMGVVTTIARRTDLSDLVGAGVTPRILSAGLLVATLFASYVSAAVAMRFFNHAGFLVSLPVNSELRASLTPQAVAYLVRAGRHYSSSIRVFFCLVPLVVAIISPVWMPLATIATVAALAAFDRVPQKPHS